MILYDVEEIGGRHREEILVEELAAEARGRLRDGRGQQPGVADSVRAAVTLDLDPVQYDDVVDAQEIRIHSASFLRTLS